MTETLQTLVVAAALALVCGAPQPAHAQRACPAGMAVTSALTARLPIYGNDVNTPAAEVRGKTRANSLNWPVVECLTQFYKVDIPGMGRGFVRKSDVQTNVGEPVEDTRPWCDPNVAIQQSYEQNRNSMGGGGRNCRSRTQ